MEKAGAKAPSANRITLLRDANSDGRPEVRSKFIEGLNSPFGMALVGKTFLCREHRCGAALRLRTRRDRDQTTGTKLADLPGGPLNHHWTKNIIASPKGDKLYATVGSNSNVAENGLRRRRAPRRHSGNRYEQRHGAHVRHPACAIPTAWIGIRKRASCGP